MYVYFEHYYFAGGTRQYTYEQTVMSTGRLIQLQSRACVLHIFDMRP
jgi:hypothetical protein